MRKMDDQNNELVLNEIEVRLEIIFLSHFDGEEVVVVPLGLLTGGRLGEKSFDHLSEVVK